MVSKIIKNNPQVEIIHIDKFNEPGHLCESCKHFRVLPADQHPMFFENEGVCMFEKYKGDLVSRFDGCREWEKRNE